MGFQQGLSGLNVSSKNLDVIGKPDALAIDLEGRARMLVAEGAVRAPLIAEPEERVQLGVRLDPRAGGGTDGAGR